MPAPRNILIATDVPSDMESIEAILSEEFGTISISTDPDAAVEDFERCKPSVLILAFHDLESAERYYLGLYRLSTMIHAHPHQTVILCRREDMARVYELCRKQYFHDFILYWPLVHEARYRLLMAVHYALRWLDVEQPRGPTASDFAKEAERIAEFESVVERIIAKGGLGLGAVHQSLEQAQTDIDSALDRLALGLIDHDRPEGEASTHLKRALERIRTEEVDKRLTSVLSVLAPVEQWAEGLREDFKPQLDSARALKDLAKQVRPVMLVVDDDVTHRETVGQILDEAGYEVVYAEDGVGALGSLRARHPDVVLMDVQMPELDGIAALRALKSVEYLASIPVIMMSEESNRDLVVACRKEGAIDFLVRPYRRETLLQKVRSASFAEPANEESSKKPRSPDHNAGDSTTVE